MKLVLRSLLPCSVLLTALSVTAVTVAQRPTPSPYNDGVAHMEKPPVPASKAVEVTVQGHSTTLTLDDLLKLPQTTLHVHNAHRNADEEYTGPLLSDVLAQAGLAAGKATQSLILHSGVIATGTDGYFVLYAAAEVMGSFSKGQVIVAVMKAGLPDTEGGRIQLINTMDTKPARWVHGLAHLSLVSMAAQP